MSKGKYIKDLTISESINDLFVVTMKSLNVGKNSREYLSLRLSDKTGDIEAKKWETSEAEAEQITEGQVYLV
ncbi:MAG: CMP-binding protein, partial [Abditibacteriota bacterium]|nr:CMP-binding protein [Abditibacteriota bacterium]